MDIKNYYKNYIFDTSISLDKIQNNIKINKTFEYFFYLCFKYNLSLFYKKNNIYFLYSNIDLIKQCKNIRKNIITKIILFYNYIKNDDNSNWIDIKTKIDKINDEIYTKLSEIDEILDLLYNIYDDDTLSEYILISNKKYIIEEFSNI